MFSLLDLSCAEFVALTLIMTVMPSAVKVRC